MAQLLATRAAMVAAVPDECRPPLPLAHVSDVDADGVPCRLYRPWVGAPAPGVPNLDLSGRRPVPVLGVVPQPGPIRPGRGDDGPFLGDVRKLAVFDAAAIAGDQVAGALRTALA
jgi:hypothetical protein